jgi:hypothetical protein
MHIIVQLERLEDVWGSGCIDPHFLDLGTSWRWVVSFTPLPLYKFDMYYTVLSYREGKAYRMKKIVDWWIQNCQVTPDINKSAPVPGVCEPWHRCWLGFFYLCSRGIAETELKYPTTLPRPSHYSKYFSDCGRSRNAEPHYRLKCFYWHQDGHFCRLATSAHYSNFDCIW